MKLIKKLLQWNPIKRCLLFLISKINLRCTRLQGWYRFHESLDVFVKKKKIITNQVLNGPFKGMCYPELISVGSALLPKLLGSYEYEISPLINDLCSQSYDAVVDIGCAEGYYAVGFAMRQPHANVYAFDINQKALRLCQQMAKLNQVSVTCGNFCSQETLARLDLGKHSLIISDCEGYELQLFTPVTAQLLQKHDLLIETHDHANIECSDILIRNLAPTHHISIFESVGDFAKPRRYQFKELESLTLDERFSLLSEGAPGMPQKWLFAKSKTFHRA